MNIACDLFKVFEDLVFCRLKLWCVDDRLKGFLLSWQAFVINHKQVGVRYYSPLRNCLLHLHEGLDSGTLPLTAL